MVKLHYIYILLITSTLLSRTLSFVRDASLAWLLGGTPLADSFSIAMRIPTLWRRLLAEGSLSLALTSLCVRYSTSHPYMKLLRRQLIIATIVFTTLLLIFKTPLATLLAPDALPATSAKAAQLLTLTLPYILFASLAAWRMARLHAEERYILPACAPLVYSLILATTAIIAISQKISNPATLLACALLVGGAAQCLVQYLPQGLMPSSNHPSEIDLYNDRQTYAAVRVDARRALDFDLAKTPRARSTDDKDFAADGAAISSKRNNAPSVRFLLVAITTAAVPQLAFCIAGALVSGFGTGHMAALYFAERLIEVPLGLLAVSSTMVTTPRLARLSSQSAPHILHTRKTLERLMLLTLALNIPAAFGLIAIAEPAIRVLFEHGSFSPAMTLITSQSLAAYALCIPAYALSRPFITLCTNQNDGLALLTACFVALASILLICPFLTNHFGSIGAPIGVTLGLWIYAFILWKNSRKHYEFVLPFTPVCWIIGSALVSLIGTRAFLGLTQGAWPEWLSLVGAIFVGIILYAIVLLSKEVREVFLNLYYRGFSS